MNDIAAQIAALKAKLNRMKTKTTKTPKAPKAVRGRSRSPKKSASTFESEAAAMLASLEASGALPILKEWLKSVSGRSNELVLREPASWAEAKLVETSLDGVLSSEWQALNEKQQVWLHVLMLIELSQPELTGQLASLLEPIAHGASVAQLKNVSYLFAKVRFTLDLAALVIETGLPQKEGSLAILFGLCLRAKNLAGDLVVRGEGEELAKRKAAAAKKRAELSALMTSPEGNKSCLSRCMTWLAACVAGPAAVKEVAEAASSASSSSSEDEESSDEFDHLFSGSDDERDSSPVRHSNKHSKRSSKDKAKTAAKKARAQAQAKCVDIEQ